MSNTASAGQPPHSEFVHQAWPADSHELVAIRAEVRRCLAPLSLTEDARQDLVLAVSEAATNAIEHAYRPATEGNTVALTFWTEPDSVYIEVVDHGTWQPPTGRPEGGGYGIPVMQRIVQSIAIHYDARGTRVLLSHPLPGEARALPGGGEQPISLQLEPVGRAEPPVDPSERV